MGYPTKIATCCFCGSRAALTLDRGRHELACASCGAPLRALKMLPRQTRPERSERKAKEGPAPGQVTARKNRKSKSRPKARKRLRWFKDMAEEVFDFVEDIFD